MGTFSLTMMQVTNIDRIMTIFAIYEICPT